MLNPVATTSGQFTSLSSVSHSSSGDWVALAGEARKEGREGERGLVVVWSPITGMTQPLVSSPEKVTAVSFSPGGKYLLIGTDVASEAEVRLIDVQTGQDAIPVKKFKHGIKAGAVSKQANRIAVSTDEGKALAWNGGNSKPILEFSDAANVQAISFAPDGMRLAVVGCYHQPGPYGGKGWASIDVIEIDSGKKTSCSVSSTKFITAVEFSRDGTELLVGTDTGYACAPHLLRLDSEDLRQIARMSPRSPFTRMAAGSLASVEDQRAYVRGWSGEFESGSGLRIASFIGSTYPRPPPDSPFRRLEIGWSPCIRMEVRLPGKLMPKS